MRNTSQKPYRQVLLSIEIKQHTCHMQCCAGTSTAQISCVQRQVNNQPTADKYRHWHTVDQTLGHTYVNYVMMGAFSVAHLQFLIKSVSLHIRKDLSLATLSVALRAKPEVITVIKSQTWPLPKLCRGSFILVRHQKEPQCGKVTV